MSEHLDDNWISVGDAAASALSKMTFADMPVMVDPSKMYDFLMTLSLEDSGLYARCLAIGIENGFDVLDDDKFMIKRARLSRIKWLSKKDFLKRKIKDTYGEIWFVPDAGRV